MIDLHRLTELEKAATPGPWWSDAFTIENSKATICDCTPVIVDYPQEHGEYNAELITFLRNNAKEIIQELKKFEEFKKVYSGLTKVADEVINAK